MGMSAIAFFIISLCKGMDMGSIYPLFGICCKLHFFDGTAGYYVEDWVGRRKTTVLLDFYYFSSRLYNGVGHHCMFSAFSHDHVDVA